FTIFRAATAIMRKAGSGSLVAFTSGAFQGSVAQANYSAAKGGIVSLVRSAALGLYRYGVRANAVAPVARTRMSENVPAGLVEIGEAEDVAPMCAYLLSDRAADVTGQIYTAVGSRIAVWNQPQEVRSMTTEGRWTPEAIADRIDEIGQEEMPLMGPLKDGLAKAQQEAEA
ncbi:MAG: SDR family oxidoreductase, partial [Actinomycetota bacterium]